MTENKDDQTPRLSDVEWRLIYNWRLSDRKQQTLILETAQRVFALGEAAQAGRSIFSDAELLHENVTRDRIETITQAAEVATQGLATALAGGVDGAAGGQFPADAAATIAWLAGRLQGELSARERYLVVEAILLFADRVCEGVEALRSELERAA